MMTYTLYQIERPGNAPWVSEPFTTSDLRSVRQDVIAGFLFGQPRWATDQRGTFLYGLDANGKEMRQAPRSESAAK